MSILFKSYIATHNIFQFEVKFLSYFNLFYCLLQLYASVLMKDPVSVPKAKTLLEKALQVDQLFLPAVYLLAELYEQVYIFIIKAFIIISCKGA